MQNVLADFAATVPLACTRAGQGGCHVQGQGQVDAHEHHDDCRRRQVQHGPHHRRVRQGHLGRQALRGATARQLSGRAVCLLAASTQPCGTWKLVWQLAVGVVGGVCWQLSTQAACPLTA